MKHGMTRRYQMEDNYYNLSYRHGDEYIDYEFSADLTIDEFAEHLRRFMAACSWTKSQIDHTICADCD